MKTKFLIVRFSSIGDIVLTTPVIRCLKQQFDGDAEIHYLTKKKYAGILRENPYLDKVHAIEERVPEVGEQLKEEGFDFVIDLHKNLRSSQVKSRVKAVNFSFSKLNFEKWMLVNFKIDRLPGKHIADRYLDTLRHFDIEYDGQGLDYFIPEKDRVEISTLPETHRQGYIAFAIGGTYNTKKLPDEKIISVCRKLSLPVVLIGGEEDGTAAGKVTAMVGKDKVFNACGKFSINQSASLVGQSQGVISHDTGMMHIAAALDKPLVSIWGNTIPKFGMYPLMKRGSEGKSQITEVKDLPCRPCTKLGHAKCPKKHFYCMNLIDEEQVVDFFGKK